MISLDADTTRSLDIKLFFDIIHASPIEVEKRIDSENEWQKEWCSYILNVTGIVRPQVGLISTDREPSLELGGFQTHDQLIARRSLNHCAITVVAQAINIDALLG